MNEQKYFLAVIPPEAICKKIEEIKAHFAGVYASKGALRSPAHITVHMPFLWKENKEDQLFEYLEKAPKPIPFSLKLNGFGAFAPKTIFIKNDYSESLMDFQKQLIKYTWRQMQLFNGNHNRGFNPHITVAFRDLKKPAFEQAWQEFESKTFEAEFTVSSFWLLKHNGKVWELFREFKFH